jgi:hypothetical protein
MEGLGTLKKSNDIIGNQIRDPPVCSIVPQTTTFQQENSQTVLRAAAETETKQENIRDYLSWMKETLDFSF